MLADGTYLVRDYRMLRWLPKKCLVGSQAINTRPLIWTGSDQGKAWEKRPLPLSNSKNCIFLPSVTNALDGIGIA
jgi:hypothetical protein